MQAASERFRKIFIENEFGHSSDVCDRLWFKEDLKNIRDNHRQILTPIFQERDLEENDVIFRACANCYQTLDRGNLPANSTSNGFRYPPKPCNLPDLDPISIRLISPRIPFMSIRRLRRDGQYGIMGQVINVPVDVNSMVQQLPRRLDDDFSFNVCLKRKLIHKSSYLSGFVNKRDLKIWLEYLVRQPLYRHFNISVDWSQVDVQGDLRNPSHSRDQPL